MIEKDSIKVVLDEEATIIDFECNLLNVISYDKDEVIGKNWFNEFISDSDMDKVKKVFKEMFESRSDEKWHTFKNDIRCKDNQHYLIDFKNHFEMIDGKMLLVSIGKNHMSA